MFLIHLMKSITGYSKRIGLTMTISKKLLSIGFLASITTIISAVSMKGFDSSLLTTYIQRAEYELQSVHNALENTTYGPRHVFTGKAFAKKLYVAQKALFKSIKKELKLLAELQKYNERYLYLEAQQLYKAFKHWVYKSWKKRVKAHYKEAKNSNDPAAWEWIHQQNLL